MKNEELTELTAKTTDTFNDDMVFVMATHRCTVADTSVVRAFRLVDFYCQGRGLPRFEFGVDLDAKQKNEEQLTRLLTQIRKDRTLDLQSQGVMIEYVRWHRGLYRLVLEDRIEDAVAELGKVGARKIPDAATP